MLAPPQQTKTPSIGVLAEEVKLFSYHRKKIDKFHKVKKQADVNFAELLNMDVLGKIRQAFVKNTEQANTESLTAAEFIDTLSEFLPRSEIERLYKKIDVNDDGFVDWQEFTGFLTTSEAGVGTVSKTQTNIFTLKMEQEFNSTNHRDMIDMICFSAKPIPILATAARDGQIFIWNQPDLKHIGTVSHIDKSRVFLNGLMSSMNIHQRAMVAKSAVNNPVPSSKKAILVTSLAVMPQSGHICVSSGDCCVALYELSTQEICGRISSFTEIPTTLEAFVIVDKIRDTINQYLAIGDSKGYLHLVAFDKEFGVSVDAGSKKKNQQLMKVAVDNMTNAKVHKEWITSMVFVTELNRLVIGSLDGTVSLVNVQNVAVDRVFEQGAGVRFVAWSNTAKFLVSAGTDRVLMIWDPYTLQIATKLDGLPSLIVYLGMNDAANYIMVVLEDKSIRMWDAATFEAQPVVYDTSTQLPINIMTAALWVPSLSTLYTAGSRLSAWQLERTNESLTVSEDDDLLTVLFNRNFHQVITVTIGGVVSVYSMFDGHLVSKFSASQNDTCSHSNHKNKAASNYGIRCATLDHSQRRLMIVSSDGEHIHMWNFHNGQCVKTIRPRIPSTYYSVASNTPLPANARPYDITCVMYEHVYSGPSRSLKKLITFGTDIGVVSSMLESSEDIDEEPSFNLVKTAFDGKKLKFFVTTGESGSAERELSVKWIVPSIENYVLVGYQNGTVLHWDLERATQGVELSPSDGIGVPFVALRRRGLASRSSVQRGSKSRVNAPRGRSFRSSKPRVSIPKNVSLCDKTMDSPIPNPPTAAITDPPNSRENQDCVYPPPDNTSVEGRKEASRCQESIICPTRPTVHNPPKRLSVVYSEHVSRRQQIDEEDTPLPPYVVIDNPAPPAVIGVAKASFQRPSLDPLLPSKEPPTRKNTVSAGRRVTEVSSTVSNYEERPCDSKHFDRAQAEDTAEAPETVESKCKSGPQDVREIPETNKLDMSSLEQGVAITCVTALRIQKIAIGACSDFIIRFWDLETGKVLCSCPFDDTPHSTHASTNNSEFVDAVPSSMLMCFSTNENQDILVGGYTNGDVKVWIVSFQSLTSLRFQERDFLLTGLAVPPLQLLSEWNAHGSAVLRMEYITLDEEEFGQHEGYIVTCSDDQDTHIWTTSGDIVGTFGVSVWDINLKNTWKPKDTDFLQLKQESAVKSAKNAVPPPPHSPRRKREKCLNSRWAMQRRSVDPEETKAEDYMRTIKLQIHMEKLQEKIAKPHVTATTHHNDVFTSSAVC